MTPRPRREDFPGDALSFYEAEGLYLYHNYKVVSEREFQKWMQVYSRSNDWFYYHTETSYRSPSGFPDCVLVRSPEIIFAELKSCLVSAKVGKTQQEWLDALQACNLEVHLWRPSDIPEIMTRLKRPW